MLYESLLLLGVLSIAFIAPHVLTGVIWGMSASGSFLWLHLFLVLGAYFVWFWQHGGQTLAMQTWRVRLVDARSAGKVAPLRALLRYVLAWPSLGCLGLGLVWALFDRDGQFLHDRLAGTRIIQA